jgi:predicted nucleotidyltransferase
MKGGAIMNRREVLLVLARSKPELARRFGVVRLALFGSMARDEAHPGSDVDIVVSFDGLTISLVFMEDDEALTSDGIIRTIYDPTAGTGGFLSSGMEYVHELNPQAVVRAFGQELNPESYAICKADMLIKGQEVDRIKLGNTLSNDQLYGDKFDYMLSNPPFGVDWEKVIEFQADSDLHDNENIPLDPSRTVTETVAEYFKKEVAPHAPDAWIDAGRRDEKDGELGIIGYEIPFNRHFYIYTPPRALEEIDRDLDAVSREIMALLREVHG